MKRLTFGLAAWALSASALATGLRNHRSGGETRKRDGKMNEDVSLSVHPLGFQWKTKDPFLFCVHHEDFYPSGNEMMGPDASLEGRDMGQDFNPRDGWRMYHGGRVPGFPEHPHRGFETVTVVRKGMVDHADSLGAAGRYGSGDVQWMTAGKGVQHAEMFPLLSRDSDNTLELFQIWLNLPAAKKFAEPNYKMLWKHTIPTAQMKDTQGKRVTVDVIAGKFPGVGVGEEVKAPAPPPDSWAADAENQVGIWLVSMEAGAMWTLPQVPQGVTRSLYFYRGKELALGQHKMAVRHGAEIEGGGELKVRNAEGEALLLYLQAKPIAEPVAQYGPFVMNTQEEIQQAFRDYRETRFGGWPWPASDPVHPRTKGRFALYADGREDVPPS